MTFSLAGCSGSAGKETEAASAAETTAETSTEAETSAEATADAETSIDKLHSYLCNVPVKCTDYSRGKIRESSRRSSAFRLSTQSLLPALTRHRLSLPVMFRILYAVGATSVILVRSKRRRYQGFKHVQPFPEVHLCMYSKDESLTTQRV